MYVYIYICILIRLSHQKRQRSDFSSIEVLLRGVLQLNGQQPDLRKLVAACIELCRDSLGQWGLLRLSLEVFSGLW